MNENLYEIDEDEEEEEEEEEEEAEDFIEANYTSTRKSVRQASWVQANRPAPRRRQTTCPYCNNRWVADRRGACASCGGQLGDNHE